MRPIAFLVLTLGLIAVGLYSASAKPPVASEPTPAYLTDDVQYFPSAPETIAPSVASNSQTDRFPESSRPAGQPTPLESPTFDSFGTLARPAAPATSSAPVSRNRAPDDGFAFEEPSSNKTAYLRLAQQYAELMTEDELVAESAELERKIETKQSENTLQSVRQMLEQIAERYPSTPAAARALKMLEQLDAPIPDDSAPAGPEVDPLFDSTLPAGSNTPPIREN